MADSKTLTRRDVQAGLQALGLKPGDHVIVHTALTSFGRLADGPDTLIDALLNAVGDQGTVVMPTFGGQDDVFDPCKTPSGLGAVTQAFWQRSGALRSRHPLASVAAIGAKAQWLIADHPQAKTAHGHGTPYHRLAQIGGKILLLGVDQDRNTFLHTAETLAKAVYLKPARQKYLNRKGRATEGRWTHFPGPHRNFIGLQSWLEAEDLVAKRTIGRCVAQLMPMAQLLEALEARLGQEPDLFISPNPNLPDGISQRAAILRSGLKQEAFIPVIDTQYAGKTIEPIIDNARRFGIDRVLLSYVNDAAWQTIPAAKRRWYLQGLKQAGLKPWGVRMPNLIPSLAADLLHEARAQSLIVPSTAPLDAVREIASQGLDVYLENIAITSRQTVDLISQVRQRNTSVRLAFNPAQFVQVGERPFLDTYATHVRRAIGALYINDALPTGQATNLEEGLAEIKELISILRSRSFGGAFILQGPGPEHFQQTAGKFFDMLKELGR